jgi:predicted DNA-binding transcriptional regulator AlpA
MKDLRPQLPPTDDRSWSNKHNPRAEMLSARGLAASIGKSYSWVLHNRDRLPAPTWIGGELRWPMPVIQAWIEAQGTEWVVSPRANPSK